MAEEKTAKAPTPASPFEEAPPTSPMAVAFQAEYLDYVAKAGPRLEAMKKHNNAYMGFYDFAIPEDQSDVYPQMTRVFVAAAISKLIEVMLPSNGDRPWVVDPTPIPRMPPTVDIPAGPDGKPIQLTPDQIGKMARRAADGMANRFEDNFIEMDYDSQLVDAIHDFAIFGSMVFMGPYRKDKPSSRWRAVANNGELAMKRVADTEDIRPYYSHIPFGSFFPDPYVSDIRDAYAAWTHEIVGKQTVHRLISIKGYDSDAIYDYLAQNPNGDWDGSGHEADMMITAGQESLLGMEGKFVIKERYGFVDAQTLISEGKLPENASPYNTYMSHTIMLGDKIIYFTMDGMEHYTHPPFIVTPYERKIGSMFGRGVPEQMKDPQSVTGSLVRAMVDNLAYAVAPLTEIDADLVDQTQTPNKLTPRMVVIRRQRFPDSPNNNQAVRFTNVPALLEVIMPSLGYFKELCQLQTSLPFATMNMNDQASGIRTIGQQTAHFKAMEGFIRLVVTNIDQRHTIPILNSMYDWEMTFNKDNSIKGDFRISAKGVRGALAREVLTQRRLEVMQIAASSPAMTERMKPNRFIELMNRDMGVAKEDLFMDDSEWAEYQQRLAANKAAEIAAQAEARRFKAETPVKDGLVQLATANKDVNSKAWPAQQAAAYRALGETDNQLYALLSAMAEDAAKNIDPDKAAVIESTDFKPPATNKSAKPDRPSEEAELPYGEGVEDITGEMSAQEGGYGEGVDDAMLPPPQNQIEGV